jgi:hypothetical protein
VATIDTSGLGPSPRRNISFRYGAIACFDIDIHITRNKRNSELMKSKPDADIFLAPQRQKSNFTQDLRSI